LPKEKGLDRLFVEDRVSEVFRNLTQTSTKNASILTQPFKENKDTFLWAVSLGVKFGSRKPLEDKREGLLRWDYLSNDEKQCLGMLALAETGDINVLKDEGTIQEIAEEYANQGIRILKQYVYDGAGDPLWKLVNLVRTEENKQN
jgi:dnd system-associated protein 4